MQTHVEIPDKSKYAQKEGERMMGAYCVQIYIVWKHRNPYESLDMKAGKS